MRVLVSDLIPGQVILHKGQPLTITEIHYRKGSLTSLFILSCHDEGRVVKLSVREGSEMEVLR